MLNSIITEAGGNIVLSKIVGDNLKEIQSVLKEALQKSDIIIFSGGVSVGPHDLVKTVSENAGFKTLFWRVNQKPGKPLFTAKKNSTFLFGLPGNPVSAYMCFLLYVMPVIQYLLGEKGSTKIIRGQLKDHVHNKLSRDHLMRVKIESDAGISKITPLEKQGSHMLTSLTEAGGFILVKANESLKAESFMDVYLY
jgi:molybdopterin molybdotransferase